jgi:hypothetical protein
VMEEVNRVPRIYLRWLKRSENVRKTRLGRGK